MLGVRFSPQPIALTASGSAIPDYTRERLFECFYSLPRPDTGRKSIGLVREVAQLRGDSITVDNVLDATGVVVGVAVRSSLSAG